MKDEIKENTSEQLDDEKRRKRLSLFEMKKMLRKEQNSIVL